MLVNQENVSIFEYLITHSTVHVEHGIEACQLYVFFKYSQNSKGIVME